VAEVVDVAADLVDQAAGGQLLEGGHRLLVAAAAGRPGGVDVEGAAEHGRGGQHLPGRVADPADPGRQQVAGPAGSRAGSSPSLAHRGQVLQHQEGQPLGALVQQPGRPGPGRGHGGDQLGHPAASRRASSSTLPRAGPAGLGGQPAQAGVGRDLLGAPAGDHQQGAALEPVDQVGEHVQEASSAQWRSSSDEQPGTGRRRRPAGPG
jgi:hypothetical protein